MRTFAFFISILMVLIAIQIPAQNNKDQTPPAYRVTKISEAIILDGIPDEPVWQSIDTLPMVMYSPVFGNPPTESSTIKIAYDDEYFYVCDIKFPVQVQSPGRK